ncbi:MAG: NAD-dependent deacylase [Candidatus Cloacimonetes bacterium]|nr:NAD-dependent deacylase [Candidatus Cloacimonadota bacterium]
MSKQILVLTGAGISAESGLKTFRDSGGLWEDHAIEDVATPEGFAADPELVWRFYKMRYQQAEQARPNAGHYALAELEEVLGEQFHIITQNVDGLHQKAGSKRVLEMHGRLKRCFCTDCHKRYEMSRTDLSLPVPVCDACRSVLRPDIVWFGEIPYYLSEIDQLLRNCDLFLVIGTSGVVYPAAGFVLTARYHGARTISINPNEPANNTHFDECIQSKAGDFLPSFVAELKQQVLT